MDEAFFNSAMRTIGIKPIVIDDRTSFDPPKPPDPNPPTPPDPEEFEDEEDEDEDEEEEAFE